jgi:hypothetical protein
MKHAILGLALLGLMAGCDATDGQRSNCIDEIKQAYCKPITMVNTNGSSIVYDCSGVNSIAYDAAIRICIENASRIK